MTEWNTTRPGSPAPGDLHTYNNVTYRARKENDSIWVWDAVTGNAGASHDHDGLADRVTALENSDDASSSGLIDVFDITINSNQNQSYTVPNYVAGQRLLAMHPQNSSTNLAKHMHELPTTQVYDSVRTLNMWNDKGTIRWYNTTSFTPTAYRTILRFGPASDSS